MSNQPPAELRAVARQAAKDELADADEYTRQIAGHIGEVILQAVWQVLETSSYQDTRRTP